jgi:hypothetical protein
MAAVANLFQIYSSKSVHYDVETRQKSDNNLNETFNPNTGRFVDYIKGILKRDFTLPTIK